MKSVYILRRGSLVRGRFEFYHTEVYSSLKKANDSIDQSILINEGFGVQGGEGFIDNCTLVTYETYDKESGNVMKLRIELTKTEVR